MTRAREAARLIGNNTFRLDSNNAVGFNSTTPDAMFDINHGLTVAGVSTFSGNVTMEGDLTVQGTTTTLDTTLQEVDLINVQANASVPAIGVTQSGSGNLASFYDGTTEVFTIADGGGVGIGSASPQQLLDLASTAPNIRFTDTADGHSEIDGNAASLKFNADKGNSKANTTITFHVDNSEKLRITSAGNVSIQNDSGKFTAGASDDLQFYHTGSASYITNATGTLFTLTDTFEVKGSNGNETHLKTVDNGAVQLYHNNSVRVATTADGVDISGTGSIKVPVGTTAERNGSPTAGDLRYNSDNEAFEGYTSSWGALGGFSKTETWLFAG